MEIAGREIFWEIPIGPYILYPLAVVTIAILCFSIYRRYKMWRLGKPENRLDKLNERIKIFIKTGIIDGLVHRRFFKEPYPGLVHFLIFWGCIILLLGAFLDFLSHYIVTFLEGRVYLAESLIVDIFGILALIGVIIAFIRRYIQKPSRLDNKPEDAIALSLILVIVLTGFFLEGTRMVATGELSHNPEWSVWSPGGYVIALLFQGVGKDAIFNTYQTLWWFHTLLAVGSVIYVSLTFSKLSHIFTATANAFFRSLKPKGALTPMDLENAESFGVSKIEQFTWKQLFDLDACTRCGRCQDQCPAHLSGKPLSPKKLVQDLKAEFESKGKVLCSKPKAAEAASNEAAGEPAAGEKALIGQVIEEEVLWSCTTCRACTEICPVFIEHIDKIVDMRRNLILEQAKMPETAMGILDCIEKRGHTCRGTLATRTDWTSGLDIKLVADDKNIAILYWTGCFASLEDRNIKVAIATGKILKSAGVNFGILGTEETCCGEPARRLGNEYLYQIQAQRNIETLNGYGVKKIVTTCPHCYNTIKNEYPQFGGNFEVIHHTQFINQLIREGKLKLTKKIDGVVTYHDSCYLGRYNSIYLEPREVLKSANTKMVEMKRHGDRGFCCGGGGGRFWIEERTGKRINEMRSEQVIETGADTVATACPFCLQMFEDGIKAKGKEEAIKRLDIAEIVIRAIE